MVKVGTQLPLGDPAVWHEILCHQAMIYLACNRPDYRLAEGPPERRIADGVVTYWWPVCRQAPPLPVIFWSRFGRSGDVEPATK